MIIGLTLILAYPVLGEEVPQDYRGVFGSAEPTGHCAVDGPVILLNGNMAVYLNPQPQQITVLMGEATWAGGAVLMSRGEEFSILPPLDRLDRCSSAPSVLKAAFGETLALFPAMDDIRSQCTRGQSRRCIDEFISLLDVSRDQRLSPAEISRGLRAFGAYVAYETAVMQQRSAAGAAASMADNAVPIQALYAGMFAVGVAAQFVTSSLLDSYDYDGDRFLAATEILQDREDLDLEAMAVALGSRLGDDGLRSVISNLIGLLGKSGGGLLGLR